MARAAIAADTAVMRPRTIAALVCISALLPGAGVASATTSPPPHTYTASSQTGQTIHMHIGDKLKVHLSASFHSPTSTRPAVLKRTRHAGGYPTTYPATATFKALAKGRAVVNSTTDYACRHTTPPCEVAQQAWYVNVVVR
jgi:hypothetical protein